MGKSSQRKGAAGERELAALLSAAGYECQRGGSFSFGEIPDVLGLPGIHIEVKRVEKLNIGEAMEQAIAQTEACLKATEEANKIIISQSGLDAILAAVKDYYERIRELETDININVDGGTPKSTDLLLVKGGTPFTTDYDKYIAGTSHTI